MKLFLNSKETEQQKDNSISVPERMTIYAGNTARLQVASDKDEEFTIVAITSLDQSIATVCNDYIIANNAGDVSIETVVTISENTYKYTTLVTVEAGEVTVKPSINKVFVGETIRIKSMVSCGVYKSVSYQSDNLKVAMVRQDGIYGLVTGISEGQANITVTVNVGNIITEKTLTLKVEASEDSPIPIANPINAVNHTDEDEWKGSRVFFGSFEQDNNLTNGSEPILWRVLDIEDDTILLLSEYGLLCKFYNDFVESVTWETSTIRAWLNNTFLGIAFTGSEINAINNTKIKTPDNKKYGSSGGNKTIDKVFLLSKKDVNNTAYGFQKGSRRKSKTRTLKITKHALVEGYANKENRNTCWWLRNPGIANQYASYVLTSGKITDGYFVGRRNDAIRPAMRIKRSSVIFGEEISDGKYKGHLIIAKDMIP